MSATPGERRAHRLGALAILVLAAALRLFRLDAVPPGLYCDEASTGYDAWSLLETGRDQYGERFPLLARSFGDYNEVTYRYLVVPSVALLGRTEWAVRLPAALLGLLGVGVAMALGRRFFPPSVALLAGLLLATSPWHVQFSRIGIRAILLPLAVSGGLALFLRGVRSPRWLIPAALVFSLGLHTYSPARAFVPALVLAAAIVHRRELRAAGAPGLVAAGLFVGAIAALLPLWISEEGLARARYDLKYGPLEILRNYFGYFDPRFLFLEGDPLIRQNPKGVALLHAFEGLTVAAGLFRLVRDRDRRAALLGAWLLLVPFPAAITAPAHATRALAGAPLFALLSAYGLAGLVGLARGRARLAAGTVAAVVIAASVVHYARVYFDRYPRDGWAEWQYGMGEAIRRAEAGSSELVFVSDLFFLPHIFVLFYAGIPPADYQARPLTGLRQGQWGYTDVAIGRYRITALERMPRSGDSLMILPPNQARFAVERLGGRLVHAVEAPGGGFAVCVVAPGGGPGR